MVELFFYVGLPYLAFVLAVAGTALRLTRFRYSISSLSSQFLEKRWLGSGSVPWHLGILVVFVGHLVAFLFPASARAALSIPVVLHVVEFVGLASATACLLGLLVLGVRRLLAGRMQAVSSWTDFAVLGLLVLEVTLGLSMAVSHRWGALWATGTVMPYLWSLLTFAPRPELVTELPALVRLHLLVAFVILGFAPFTRLLHAVVLPVSYWVRAPQRVIWTSQHHADAMRLDSADDPSLARRHLIEGAVGVGAAAGLLGLGAADKLARYLTQAPLTHNDRVRVLAERHQRLVMTAEERALELERLSNEFILVAAYRELSTKAGKYFIDYEMRPGLAFIGDDGTPILLSAKCTHLGCTVGKDLDAQGRILCPCHVSYFDVKTGAPDPSAPAKTPLPRIPWVARDEAGKVVAAMGTDGKLLGSRDKTLLGRTSICMTKAKRPEVT